MHGRGLAFVPGSEPGPTMKGSEPDVPPPLGRKIEPPKLEPAAPVWKPLRPGYVQSADGKTVKPVPMP